MPQIEITEEQKLFEDTMRGIIVPRMGKPAFDKYPDGTYVYQLTLVSYTSWRLAKGLSRY